MGIDLKSGGRRTGHKVRLMAWSLGRGGRREGGRAVGCGHDAEDGGGMLLRFGLGPRALAGMFTGDAVAGRVDELLWMERLRGVREERA
jgi:hypothetical protein